MILRPYTLASSTLRHLASHPFSTRQPQCLPRRLQLPTLPLPRPFSTTGSLLDDQNHYQILGVEPSVSPSDLKKRFYILSRETHPDLHPNDPNANSRFQAISESYSILGNPDKRKKYDRDVMRQRPAVRGNEGRGGTYAGSRAPSGLSKRRSAFKGPPPSYFKHGQGARSESRGGMGGPGQGQGPGQAYYEGNYGPTSSFEQTGDFDPSRVYKTQTIEDERRERRREAAAQAAIREMEQEGDFWVRFVIVTVIVVGGVSIGSMLVHLWDRPTGGGMVKGDGSLRKTRSKEVQKA